MGKRKTELFQADSTGAYCYIAAMKRPNDPSAPSKALFNWYPGHMARALREIKQKLNLVDVVLEIRDARVPLSSGNDDLNLNLGQKKRLIVLNKANLADVESVKKWSAWFDQHQDPYLFINCFDRPSMKKVVSMARKLVEENRKKCNPEYVSAGGKLRMMIIGLPNTGKSTIINQLAQKNATKVADRPGQTQVQQWITVDNEIELLDTPGVMPPSVESMEHGLWLSAIHAIPDERTDEETTAIFVIKHLIAHKSKEFQDRFKLTDLDIGLDEVLLKIATLRGCLIKSGLPDLSRVYKLVLSEFRKGELGQTTFELPPKDR